MLHDFLIFFPHHHRGDVHVVSGFELIILRENPIEKKIYTYKRRTRFLIIVSFLFVLGVCVFIVKRRKEPVFRFLSFESHSHSLLLECLLKYMWSGGLSRSVGLDNDDASRVLWKIRKSKRKEH